MKNRAIAIIIATVLMTAGGLQAGTIDWVYTWDPDDGQMGPPNLGYHGNPRENWFNPFVDETLTEAGVQGIFNSGWGELGEPGPSGAGVAVNIDYVRDFGVEIDGGLTLGSLTISCTNIGIFGNTVTWDSGDPGVAAVFDADYWWGTDFEAPWHLNSDLHFRYNHNNDRQTYRLPNVISGEGKLILEPNNTQTGLNTRQLRMTGDPNTYSGGTEIRGQEPGTTTTQLRVEKTGAFGSGDVELTGTAHVRMEADNVIAAGASLFVGADAIWEMIGEFSQTDGIYVFVDGTPVTMGVYDTEADWLTGDGTGTLNVIPEPGTVALLGLTGLVLFLRRRFARG